MKNLTLPPFYSNCAIVTSLSIIIIVQWSTSFFLLHTFSLHLEKQHNCVKDIQLKLSDQPTIPNPTRSTQIITINFILTTLFISLFTFSHTHPHTHTHTHTNTHTHTLKTTTCLCRMNAVHSRSKEEERLFLCDCSFEEIGGRLLETGLEDH